MSSCNPRFGAFLKMKERKKQIKMKKKAKLCAKILINCY